MWARFRVYLMFGAFVGATATSSVAQSIYVAQERQLSIVIGTGMSNFDLDYGKDRGTERRMEGITSWVDWVPSDAPSFLREFGLEIEGRDINFGHPYSRNRIRQDTIAVGVVYNWPHYRLAQPHFQYLLGVGSIDFPSRNPRYTHRTRAVQAPGAGLDFTVSRNVKVRCAYEYQFLATYLWPPRSESQWLYLWYRVRLQGLQAATFYRLIGRRPRSNCDKPFHSGVLL